MLIDKDQMEAMIIFLFKIGQEDACDELLKVYRQFFSDAKIGQMDVRH